MKRIGEYFAGAYKNAFARWIFGIIASLVILSRFSAVNCLAVGSAPDFGCRLPFWRFPPPDFGCMASGACRIASAGPLRPLRFRCARGSRLRFPVFGPSCTRIPAVNSADCRKRCCLINLERYGRFPTQSLHYGGPDAQLHPDGRTAFHLAARRQQTHRRAGIPI